MNGRHELARLRLVAQRLAGPGWATPVEAVTHLGAVQAQDLPGALTSVALRIEGDYGQVKEALNTGQVVRSWPMRGTLHLVPAEDLGWMLSLTSARMLASAATRRDRLGITDSVLDRAREVALGSLTGGAKMSRKELFACWQSESLLSQPQTAIHLLSRLCQEATLVLGPLNGSEQLVVDYAQWVPNRRQLDQHEALTELTRRYLQSHGPATAADFARWSSLTLTGARAGCAAVRSEFNTLTVAGLDHLFHPDLPDLLDANRTDANRLMLLPGFDEFILGYGDRSFTVPPAFADQIVPGNNGMFRPTIVNGGQVIGTWKRAGTKTKPRIAAEPFNQFDPTEQSRIESAFRVLPKP